MTVPIWLICVLLTIAAWVPAARHRPRSYDFGGALLTLAALGTTVAIWVAFAAFVIGRATS